ncbi:MAG: histidine phosphatase family protein [Acidimicrobiales bacterium]
MEAQIVLVRHGETAWSLAGRHTGRTDIPLTPNGEIQAMSIAETLSEWNFVARFASPLERAIQTARLSGVDEELMLLDDLMEWDYGIFEGRTNEDILAERPGWSKWFDEIHGGESVRQVGDRADRVIDTLAIASQQGSVIAFAHGHLLAVLIARWLGMPAVDGRRFVLETGTVTVLGAKRGDRVLRIFNQACGHVTIGV